MLTPLYTISDVKAEAMKTNELINVECYKIHPQFWRSSYYCEAPNIEYVGEIDELSFPDSMEVYSIEIVSDAEYCSLNNIDEEYSEAGNHILFAVSEFDYDELLEE